MDRGTGSKQADANPHRPLVTDRVPDAEERD